MVAAALVIIAGMVAVHLARPPDPFGPVRVERVGGGASESGARTEQVQWDAEEGQGVLDVRESDGAVRRYYMEEGGGDGMRIWGGEEVDPDQAGDR
ncbi:MAG: hypothetical protein R6V07_19085 [Armatimonadota bacterium]